MPFTQWRALQQLATAGYAMRYDVAVTGRVTGTLYRKDGTAAANYQFNAPFVQARALMIDGSEHSFMACCRIVTDKVLAEAVARGMV